MITGELMSHTGPSGTERCLGPVRWVPLNSYQAHRKKLQQLYEVVEYRDGQPWLRREEWRDVPDGDY